ncbi:microtubule associated protein [Mycena amicta]|nr:microtubule associated protein [Mycena amicta]
MATLTTLLNTLQTALSSQIQLLPTLHAQLEDDLSALQDQLVRCVKAHIDERRKEVDTWMGKCELVEAQCVNYTKALGGNIKATDSSLGELRKEKVLPVRYDMVSEYQEKLRQLYHTKLEQLTTLCNRLSVLARTLGPEFYTDIIDEGDYRDVSPERFSKLEKELVRGKAEVAKRLVHLAETFVQIDWLYTEMGMVVPDIPEDDCSTSVRSRGSSGDDPFHTPTATDAARYRILADFIDKANCLPDDTPPHLEVEPTHELISWAMDLRASLEEVKRRRETHIQAMYDQLEGLWRRLGVADADMDAFVETHRGSTEETVGEYEEELERMLELKRERMGTFIQSAREEIEKLWDELMVGDEERRDWTPFFDDEHTEDLLTVHEDEIKRLKEEKRVKAPLLASIRRSSLLPRRTKADCSDVDPGIPGRLLREEKMRKRVSKEKPRLEQDMLSTIPAWEHETGRTFLVHGQSILQLLMQTVSGADQENVGSQGGKRKPSPVGRATSVPARATTPTQSYAPRTGTVTPAVRTMPAPSNSLPNKRARTETTPSYSLSKPAPLGAHRGTNGVQRNTSPSKIPGPLSRPSGITKPPTLGLPRPVQAQAQQHQALGHGRGPTVGYGGLRSASMSVSSTSNSSSISSGGSYGGRYASGGTGTAALLAHNAKTLAAKAARARRESFKPRASVDGETQRDLGLSHVRWGFEGVAVKEEDEDY